MAFPRDSDYHADSDADDEFERGSVMASPHQLQIGSDASSSPRSNEHTPTFGHGGDDGNLPATIITEWTPEECAQFLASLNLRQYCDAFIEHGVVGEALIALKHDELKEMGITSLGHRLTILKHVYDTKMDQDVPIESDDYVPLSAEHSSQHEAATKEDVARLARSLIKMRDERIAQAEAQLTRLADDYRKLRLELLPIFKSSKERSEPLPYAPYGSIDSYQEPVASPPLTASSIPEKSSVTRSLSKKLGLSNSNQKTSNSPTHIPSTIHEGRTMSDASTLLPSAAAQTASSQLSGAMHQSSPATSSLPSPTSPMPYHQPLAPSRYRENSLSRYDSIDDIPGRAQPTPTPPITHDPPKSASINKFSYSSTASTVVPPSREHSASVPPQFLRSSAAEREIPKPSTSHSNVPPPAESDPPSVEIFKSFRVALEDPCFKVLPAALRKYNIQADWRQYALYIVYGDQERCVGLDEKPLALIKDLEREGKKPMFMLRKLANPIDMQQGGSAGIGTVQGGSITMGGSGSRTMMGHGGLNTPGVQNITSNASIRSMTPGHSLPGGVL